MRAGGHSGYTAPLSIQQGQTPNQLTQETRSKHHSKLDARPLCPLVSSALFSSGRTWFPEETLPPSLPPSLPATSSPERPLHLLQLPAQLRAPLPPPAPLAACNTYHDARPEIAAVTRVDGKGQFVGIQFWFYSTNFAYFAS